MSDDSKRIGKAAEHDEPQDEVEAHKHRVAANDEPAQDGEGDDEVEAHRHIRTSEPDNRTA